MKPLLRILEICLAGIALAFLAAACLLLDLSDRMDGRGDA